MSKRIIFYLKTSERNWQMGCGLVFVRPGKMDDGRFYFLDEKKWRKVVIFIWEIKI